MSPHRWQLPQPSCPTAGSSMGSSSSLRLLLWGLWVIFASQCSMLLLFFFYVVEASLKKSWNLILVSNTPIVFQRAVFFLQIKNTSQTPHHCLWEHCLSQKEQNYGLRKTTLDTYTGEQIYRFHRDVFAEHTCN